MFTQATVITMIALESAGLLISIGVGIAVFKAWRVSKRKLEETTVRFEAAKTELRKFMDALSNI